MSETIHRESLGASIKRVFIAFLISNFMAPVGIWLGIEYIKLSGRFEAAGMETNNSNLARAAKLFKVLAVFSFCNAAMYVVNMAVIYPLVYGPLMELADNPTDPALLAGLISMIGGIIALVIASMAIMIASSHIAHAAWKYVMANLAGEQSPTTTASGSFQVARIIKGARQSFQAGIMLVIVMAFLGVVLILLIPGVFIAILAVVMAFLGIAGAILALSGTVNQAVGLFDLGRNMGIDPAIEGMMLARGEDGGTSRAGRLCLKCLHQRPDDPNVKFCPICGNPF